MDNPEEVMQILERFNVSRNPEITSQLEEYITFVARTGDSVYAWPLVKNLYREKLLNVITDFHNEAPTKELPQYPNVDPFNYETMKKMLIEKLESFSAAPFTIQRISELLSDPRKQYSRIDKFMRAVEKTILVVSTVPPGRNRSESENGDSLDSALNGEFAADVNVDVDMESDGLAVAKEAAATNQRKEQNQEVSAAAPEAVSVAKTISPSKAEGTGSPEAASKTAKDERTKIETDKDAESSKASTTDATKEVSVAPVTVYEPTTKASADANEPSTSFSESTEPSKKDSATAETPLAQEKVETSSEPSTTEMKTDEPTVAEASRSPENEILVDTSEIISETTPLAALENIVAIRTDGAVDAEVAVAEQQSAVSDRQSDPEASKSSDEIQVAAPEVEEDSEVEAKRLKLSEETEKASEKLSQTETVVEAELPAQTADVVAESPATESVDSVSVPLPEPVIEEKSAPLVEPVVDTVENTELITADADKIDEPLHDVAIIPTEVATTADQDITEAPSTDMDTNSTVITENTMSLDEDEPPAIELEMTPIANKMDTDEAEAAPMDFDDDAEPMDQ